MHPVAFGFIGFLVIGVSLLMRRWSRGFKSRIRRDAWERVLVLGVTMVGLAIYHVIRGNT